MDYLIHKAWIYVVLAGLNSTIGNLLLKKSLNLLFQKTIIMTKQRYLLTQLVILLMGVQWVIAD